MHFKFALIPFICISLAACTEKSSKTETPEPTIRETLKKNDLLSFVPFKALPLTDSTSFDDFEGKDPFSQDLVKKLHLKEIEEGNKQFFARYRVALSEGIDAVVVTSMAEFEMKTFLVTYNKEDYTVIDNLEIAYDEIAESAFSARGTISKTQAVITHYNYMDEEPVIEGVRLKFSPGPVTSE